MDLLVEVRVPYPKIHPAVQRADSRLSCAAEAGRGNRTSTLFVFERVLQRTVEQLVDAPVSQKEVSSLENA